MGTKLYDALSGKLARELATSDPAITVRVDQAAPPAPETMFIADGEGAGEWRGLPLPEILGAIAVADPPTEGGQALLFNGDSIEWGAPGGGSGGGGIPSVHLPPENPDADTEEFNGAIIPGDVRVFDHNMTPLTPVTGPPYSAGGYTTVMRRWNLTQSQTLATVCPNGLRGCLSVRAKTANGGAGNSSIHIVKTLATALSTTGGSAGNEGRWVLSTRVIRSMQLDWGNGDWPSGLFEFFLCADAGGLPDFNNRYRIQFYPYTDIGGANVGMSIEKRIAGVNTNMFAWFPASGGTISLNNPHGPVDFADFGHQFEKLGFFFDGSGVGGFVGNEYTYRCLPSASNNLSLKHVVWRAYHIPQLPQDCMHIDYCRVFRQTPGDVYGITPAEVW